jgi:transcriptional regulator GlxA family with amidase domain
MAEPLRTAVVVTPLTGSAGTFTILDMLYAPGRHWQLMHRQPITEVPVFEAKMLSADGKAYIDPLGVTITPHGRFADMPRPDLVLLPELWIGVDQPPPEVVFGPVVEWLREVYEAGAIIGTVCSGTALLAMTGLLDGEEATTHWGYCELMAQQFPRVKLRAERILVPAGPGHRLITAGGATSWNDLMLYLIGRFAGTEEARRVAKVFLVQAHDQGQLPYAGLTARRNHEDLVIRQAQLWIADNYREPNPVAVMSTRAGLTERGFHGRFRRATGMSPLEYVQTLRIEEAKQILETTDMPLDDVALEVGYSEPASFRRLFRKMVGVTPSAYRRQAILPVLIAAE